MSDATPPPWTHQRLKSPLKLVNQEVYTSKMLSYMKTEPRELPECTTAPPEKTSHHAQLLN